MKSEYKAGVEMETRLQGLAQGVSAFLASEGHFGKAFVSLMPGLTLLQDIAPTSFDAILYEPVSCLILRGQKETTLGGKTFTVSAGDSLVASHDVLVSSRITKASKAEPYLAMVFALDLGIIRSLYEQVEVAETDPEDLQAIATTGAEASLIDAYVRLFGVARDPVEANVLAPLLRTEIHFRLLMATNGQMLRSMLRHNSHASSISKAIAKIRQDYRAPLAVPELAKVAGMSASSFHKHFRAITESTPLQYQKDLRLMEARRLIADGGFSVSDAAFEVGYASPNQFSREYVRKFGATPRQHRV